MTRRKGEITARRQAQLAASRGASGRKGVGLKDSEATFSAAAALSAAPLTYPLRRDDGDFVVFCFSKPEDAKAGRLA